MFFVVEGQLLAQRPADDPKQEDVPLGHQAFFGAACFFKEAVRTRNVIAITNVELLEISTSEVYAVGNIFSEVGEELRLRLREASECKELCLHCGFAHSIEDCPLAGEANYSALNRRSSKEALKRVNSSKEAAKTPGKKTSPRLSFKQAVKKVVRGAGGEDMRETARTSTGTSQKPSNVGTKPLPRANSGFRRSTSDIVKASTSLIHGASSPRAQEQSPLASPFGITPRPDKQSSPTFSASSPTFSASHGTPRSTTRVALSRSLSMRSPSKSPAISEDDEEECLSPYSPLIKIKLQGAAE
jgi:hypothetical protein